MTTQQFCISKLLELPQFEKSNYKSSTRVKSTITPEDFTIILFLLFEIPKSNIKTIKPGQLNSLSGKFSTYQFYFNNSLVNITLSGSYINKGYEYENSFYDQLVSDTLIQSDVFNFLNIKSENVTKINKLKIQRNRIIDIDEIHRAGHILADISISTNSGDKFLSIKNKSGAGLYNGGNLPLVKLKNNTIELSLNKYKPFHKNFFTIFKVNLTKLQHGLNCYLNEIKTPWKSEWVEVEISNINAIVNFLGNCWGFDYSYIKEAEPLKLIKISNKKDVLNLVGIPTKMFIKYPYFSGNKIKEKCKSTDIKILNQTGHYLISLRSDQYNSIIPKIKVCYYDRK